VKTYDMDGNDGLGMEIGEMGYMKQRGANPGSKTWTAAAGGLLKHLLRLTGSSESQGNTDMVLQVDKSFSAFLHNGCQMM
jgi:hypothetical protein